MKVAQLTQRKSKFPFLFLVEVRKNVPDSRDIRDISTCCYMSIIRSAEDQAHRSATTRKLTSIIARLIALLKPDVLKNDRSQPHTHASGGTAKYPSQILLKHHLIPTRSSEWWKQPRLFLHPERRPITFSPSIYIPLTTNPATAISDLEVIFPRTLLPSCARLQCPPHRPGLYF
ncbi:hypothetical protein TNCV_1649531 [Trichonephila clavipes]|nr:hypothetical protein TNCV_1649531 [Trichonephila clavipes]